MRKTQDEPSRVERRKTDKSLQSERAQRDLLQDDATLSIEQSFDEAILKNRNDADSERERNRGDADADKLKDDGQKQYTVKETTRQNAAVTKERALSDSVRFQERRTEDYLRKKERIQKILVAEALLGSGRKLFDADLFDERAIMDSEFGEHAGLLLDEQALHKTSIEDLASRDRTLAIVSHDLRNPLGCIAMSAAMISSSIAESGATFEEVLNLSKIIERNAAGMDRMIGHLLDAERISQGKLHLTYQNQSIDKLLNACKDLFFSVANSKSLSISFSSEDDGIVVNCDHDRILQVLSNLIGNAIKFTPEGGTIKVGVSKTESVVEFSIIDDGPGIEEEAKKRIFDQFSQLSSDDRRGLGLGLYISKWIVEAHGGTIGISSGGGKGSVFKFTLPASPSPQNTRAAIKPVAG